MKYRLVLVLTAILGLSSCTLLGLSDNEDSASANKKHVSSSTPVYEAAPLPSASFFEP